MKVIQLLPVNDTTLTHRWGDSHPYNIVSWFALHPHYLDIDNLGSLKSEERMRAYHRQRQELNTLTYSDYEAVDRVKLTFVKEYIVDFGQQTFRSKDYQSFIKENNWWLKDYVAFCQKHNQAVEADTICFIQFHLHRQLKAAADYARSKGVSLKGDLPIGINAESVETNVHPEWFHIDMQTGVPPEPTFPNGQNWGFPTYNWSNKELVLMLRRRFRHMEQYFDALRMDHVLG
jgi:4-alpha-glucanotransferase